MFPIEIRCAYHIYNADIDRSQSSGNMYSRLDDAQTFAIKVALADKFFITCFWAFEHLPLYRHEFVRHVDTRDGTNTSPSRVAADLVVRFER